MKQEVSVELAGGKTISFETGKLAKQAHGSVVVRIGDNVVLATATANPDPREGIDFFPLTVDYREYTYAGGRIPGGFIKREGRPSEREILTSRQIDRPVRPLFPDGFRCETQVIAFVLSADTENDPDVAGITFTGSYEVGMGIYRSFATDYPKPAICEMGGKNPTIVTKNADLDKATDGVLRSAFGFGGQKCSANSRVYVQREVYDEFLSKLTEKTEAVKIGDPLKRDVFLGPLINDAAVKTYEEAADEARRSGRIVTGGERLLDGELAKGNFVKPTVVEVPLDNWIWKTELFVPFVTVAPVDTLDQALDLANDSEYGLTAGFFSEDEAEQKEFLDRIQAGVVYVNRRAGATTGAWPGVQAFGGWKGSGTTGKAGGGPYYVTQYLREQSRTVISE